jgi:2-polyprenyl-3-methyl-5-hydroxy-6-metoxy-1,4-benzoquinol methylase
MLDYGSSLPVLCREALRLGFARCIAVDYDTSLRPFAEQHGISFVHPSRLIDIPERSVDILRFSHVLEHVPDPVSLFLTVLPKLKPGGLLHITQPNIPLLTARISTKTLRDANFPTHLHFFSPLSLLTLVRAYVRVSTFFTVAEEPQEFTRYSDDIDIRYVEHRLIELKSLGEPNRGAYANFPFFAGRNSSLFGYRLPM